MQKGPENPQFNTSERDPGRKIVRSLIEGLAQQEEATSFVEDIIGVLSDPVIAEKLFYLLPLKNSQREYPQVDRDRKELAIGFQGWVYPTDFGRSLVAFSFKDDPVILKTRVLHAPLQASSPESFQKEIDQILTPSKNPWQITATKKAFTLSCLQSDRSVFLILFHNHHAFGSLQMKYKFWQMISIQQLLVYPLRCNTED